MPLVFWAVANFEGVVVHSFIPEFKNYKFSFEQSFSEMLNKNGSTEWWLKYVAIPGVLFVFIAPFAGASHFSKSPLIKVLFTFAIIAGGYALLIYLLFKGFNLKEYRPSSNRILFISSREQAFTFLAILMTAIDLALVSISWFKLKEKEA
jgi:hypothetical protein